MTSESTARNLEHLAAALLVGVCVVVLVAWAAIGIVMILKGRGER